MTPDQAIAQERARLREEVVKLLKDASGIIMLPITIETPTKEMLTLKNLGYNECVADVLALLRE
jgi:cobalamin biosynthesis Co2+ chelatase CbiK